MLKRKPQIGEVLSYNGQKWVVTHFHATNENLCWVISAPFPLWAEDSAERRENLFIWRHGDGELNTMWSHVAESLTSIIERHALECT